MKVKVPIYTPISPLTPYLRPCVCPLFPKAERDAADLAALRSQLLARAQRDSLDLQALRNEQDERDMAHRRDIAALMRQIEELKAAKAAAVAVGGGGSPGGADAATVAALRRRIAELEAVNNSLDRRLAESEAGTYVCPACRALLFVLLTCMPLVLILLHPSAAERRFF